MPIHDWSRVSAGMFHWFHQTWIMRIADWLNQGRLPEGCYAIGEVYVDHHYPDVLAVEDRPMENGTKNGRSAAGFGVAVAESPPKTRFVWESEIEGYLAKQNLLAVRGLDGILIAVIEVVSPGNKASQDAFRKFVAKTIGFLDQGVHVLIIDLFPPTPRDPCGVHQAIWRERYDGAFTFNPDKPLTLASYRAGRGEDVSKAYVEPIDVGEALPPMALFLSPDRYINVDLETTYQSAWAAYPAPLKPKIEGAT